MTSIAVEWLSLDFQPQLPDLKGPLGLSCSLTAVPCCSSQAPVFGHKVASAGLHVAEFLLSVAHVLDYQLCAPLAGDANTPVLSPRVFSISHLRFLTSSTTCAHHLTTPNRKAGREWVHPPLCPGRGRSHSH